VYRIGPELEDEHFAVLQDGSALRYSNGELTVGTLRQAAQQYLAVTGLPPETHVDVRGRARGLREAEIKERQLMVAEFATPQLLAAMLQRPAKTVLTITADGGWQFGSTEDAPETIWRTEVTPALLQAAKEAFARQIATETTERVDRIQNTQTREYVNV